MDLMFILRDGYCMEIGYLVRESSIDKCIVVCRLKGVWCDGGKTISLGLFCLCNFCDRYFEYLRIIL